MNVRACVWMLSCFTVTRAKWTTVMRSAHYATDTSVTMVTEINNSIVNTSFTSTTVLNCLHQCTRRQGIKSLYYDSTALTCYCNHANDNNAITVSSGIQYSVLQNKLAIQIEDGKQRYKLPEEHRYTTCSGIYEAGYRFSGSYFQSQSGWSMELYCNMVYANWTVFQRRYNGSVDFNRNWTDYVNGFGSQSDEFWLGLETIHQATDKSVCELLVYMEAGSTNTIQTSGYARYSAFSIGGSDDNYTLSVSGFSGNVGDALAVHNGMMFSTYDADNDATASNCASRFGGGWWFEGCHSSNLNGPYLAGDHSSFADGVNWRIPWGYHYSLLKTEMMYICT